MAYQVLELIEIALAAIAFAIFELDGGYARELAVRYPVSLIAPLEDHGHDRHSGEDWYGKGHDSAF